MSIETPVETAATPSRRAEERTNATLLERDRRYRMQTRFTHPVCLTRGKGVRLTDVAGKEYLDFESGQVCASVGHSNAEYVAAMREQLGRLVQTGSCYIDE